MERTCTYRQYHVCNNADVARKDVRMYCNNNQFTVLLFCGTYSKPHGTRGLSKHYHLRFDSKLGNGVCAIRRIPCTCVGCTSMINKPWISGILPDENAHW